MSNQLKNHPVPPPPSRKMYLILVKVFMTILLLVAVEGLCSWGNFLRKNLIHRPKAESVYTEYEPMTGWLSIKNFYEKNFFGPGVYVRINGQGFRSNEEFGINVPEGKSRLICSGDSFTFGYAVNLEETWCQKLEETNSRLQTVNMGQGGYGIDQTYLWYIRDGVKLERNLHILAFITDDFRRMELEAFDGVNKPLLGIFQDHLVVKKLAEKPAPFRLNQILSLNAVNQLAVIRGLRMLMGHFYNPPPSPALSSGNIFSLQNSENIKIALKIFEELDTVDKKSGCQFIAVYLPIESDYYSRQSDDWRKFLKDSLNKRNIPFIDLVDEFRLLPENRISDMFIHANNAIPYAWYQGHYTVKGNQTIANLLSQRLTPFIVESQNPDAKNTEQVA